ncbi:MAG: 16S rRNA (cytidine(1402)-2'-O)-methyltransferase [Candidatus Lloydbacteria bacterium]|nr:16S rRNA (cytidine(1402)-2'-O)-methyltransferase [Candidatus Lloydbacteria bacterium]
MSTLYIVATPIGNLEDMTLRAIETLKTVDLILCEDTRVTKKLLARYDIHTPTLSYHTHSGTAKSEKIISLLRERKNLALVSDAGTPSISDPGSFLVSQVREAFGHEVAIIPIPGPSALAAALSVSGFSADSFLFLGFLPHKKGRQTLFKEIAASERTSVFYESPHRILKALEALEAVLLPERPVVVAREISKMFEETVSGTVSEVCQYFQKNPDKIRGEFVVIVSPK